MTPSSPRCISPGVGCMVTRLTQATDQSVVSFWLQQVNFPCVSSLFFLSIFVLKRAKKGVLAEMSHSSNSPYF